MIGRKHIESVSCFLCGKNEYEKLFVGKTSSKPTFVVCKNCGFVYQHPRPTNDELQEYYKQKYRMGNSPDSHRPPVNVKKQVDWILGLTEFDQLNGKAILDIGSATGDLLNVFSEKGWDTFGVEPTITYAAYTANKYKHQIEVGMFNGKNFGSMSFDLITSSHVLEHIADPISFLILARNKMKNKSFLFIEVPDIKKPNININIFALTHLQVFSKVSLENVLNKAGFSLMATKNSATGIMVLANKMNALRAKQVEYKIEDAREIKKIITLFNLKLPFLKCGRILRNSYKIFYKAFLRKPLKNILMIIFAEKTSKRFFS